MLSKRKIKSFRIFLALLLGLMVVGCQPDENGIGNGLSDPDVDASFTINPVEGQPNRFVLQAAKANVLRFLWNTGGGFFSGSANDTVFLPDKGTYTITHAAIGRGGIRNTISKELEVKKSDPIAGNLIEGGNFKDQTDASKWTILKISDAGANWTFSDGQATITASDYQQQAIYQAVQVEAGQKYSIDMHVFSNGTTNSWFEVYTSPTVPVQNSEYKADGIRIGMTSFNNGCAASAFDGQLSKIGCVGSGNTVSFDNSGTIYFVIKSGGQSMGSTGISINNIEMRRSN